MAAGASLVIFLSGDKDNATSEYPIEAKSIDEPTMRPMLPEEYLYSLLPEYTQTAIR